MFVDLEFSAKFFHLDGKDFSDIINNNKQLNIAKKETNSKKARHTCFFVNKHF